MTSSINGKYEACGCCGEETSGFYHYNRPGLPSVSFRLGTHSTFFQHMLARLPEEELTADPKIKPLKNLDTYNTNDPAIVLLDAWASVLDVLTFYQERIANEGYLRTASERRSVVEMAQEIGYKLKPGVAASTYLAFTVDDTPGAQKVVDIPAGTKVQSIPEPGRLPQTFETIESIQARSEWNSIKPKLTEPHILDKVSKEVYLKGTNTGLQPGDAILFIGDERKYKKDPKSQQRWDFRIIETVNAYPEENYTLVTWQTELGSKNPPGEPSSNPKVFAFRQRAALFGHNAPEWKAMSEEIKKSYAKESCKQQDLVFELCKIIPQCPPHPVKPYDIAILTQVCNLMTEFCTQWETYLKQCKEWPDFEIGKKNQIELDSTYPKILKDSWIALVKPGKRKPNYVQLYKAEKVTTSSGNAFTLTGKITCIEPDPNENLEKFYQRRRETVVFSQSEELETTEKPLRTPVYGKQIVLNKLVEGLGEAKKLIISGKRIKAVTINNERYQIEGLPSLEADNKIIWELRDKDGKLVSVECDSEKIISEPSTEEDEIISELVVVGISESKNSTILYLKEPLKHIYDRETVTINANIALATHGETIREILGSGDASRKNQSFILKKPPLTYVPSATPSGASSTLEVRVGGIKWEEAASLYGWGPKSQSYVVQMDEQSNSRIIFGDGKNGARLPDGMENVTAVYRSGIGYEGNLEANKLILLQDRPQGVREVCNPVPASGAANPERMADAKKNIPGKMLTFDRVVSLTDFENFARAYAGIEKSKVKIFSKGQEKVVHITIAGSGDSKSEGNGSGLKEKLLEAINSQRDLASTERIEVERYRLRTFSLKAEIVIDISYIAKKVLGMVEQSLKNKFSFEEWNLGEPVTAAKVMTVIQSVKGVAAVVLKELKIDEENNKSLSQESSKIKSDEMFSTGSSATIEALHAGGIVFRASPLMVNQTHVVSEIDYSFLHKILQSRFQDKLQSKIPVSVPMYTFLEARDAREENGKIIPAELLLLRPDGIDLKELVI